MSDRIGLIEISQILKCRPQTALELATAGLIPARKVDENLEALRGEILDWLANFTKTQHAKRQKRQCAR